jgi:hypothetical protein
LKLDRMGLLLWGFCSNWLMESFMGYCCVHNFRVMLNENRNGFGCWCEILGLLLQFDEMAE